MHCATFLATVTETAVVAYIAIITRIAASISNLAALAYVKQNLRVIIFINRFF